MAYNCPRCGVPATSYTVAGVQVAVGELLSVKLVTGLEPVVLKPCGHVFLLGEATTVAQGVDQASAAEWQTEAQGILQAYEKLFRRAAQTGYGAQVEQYRAALMGRTGEAPRILDTLTASGVNVHMRPHLW